MGKQVLHSIALVVMVFLGGCSTMPGTFNGLGSDPMSMLVVYRTDKQQITEEQYKAVGAIAQEASNQVGLQLSSSLEAAISSGFPFGIAGAGGGAVEGGLAAGAAGTAGFLGGFVGGLQNASYANVWLVADITEVTLRDREASGDKTLKGLHVSAAFIRTGNTVVEPAHGLIRRK
mgnify:CR=1 FL=1